MGISLSLRQLPREGAMYRETHVAGAFSAADGKPLSARGARSGTPRGVVLHAVSARDAGRRTFGREECATWDIATAESNSLSLSGVYDDRGQHAADTAAAREPCTGRLM